LDSGRIETAFPPKGPFCGDCGTGAHLMRGPSRSNLDRAEAEWAIGCFIRPSGLVWPDERLLVGVVGTWSAGIQGLVLIGANGFGSEVAHLLDGRSGIERG